jgi:adenine-specific DNA glycosylase
MPVSESAWKRLNDAQERLQEEEEQAMAKILRLRKQQKLLKKRAGEFLQKDIKDISELEKLEEEEEKQREAERQKQAEAERAKQAERDQQELIASLLNVPTVGGQDAVGSDVFSFLNQSYLDIPESYHGNSNS